MPTRRAIPVVCLLAAAALILPAMRQDITLDDLDLRTIDHSTRIAQLEMELSALRAELDDLRENLAHASDNPAPIHPDEPSALDPDAIPAHKGDNYYFRLTAIVELEKDNSLFIQINEMEKIIADYRQYAASGQGRYGKKLSQSEVNRYKNEAATYERDLKQLKLEYENPGVSLSGFDHEGRDVTCIVTGPAKRQALKLPPDSIVRASGELEELDETTLVLNNARAGRVHN